MKTTNNEYYTVSTDCILRETAKAYLVRLQVTVGHYGDATIETWVPKSRSHIEGGNIHIESWIIQRCDSVGILVDSYRAHPSIVRDMTVAAFTR